MKHQSFERLQELVKEHGLKPDSDEVLLRKLWRELMVIFLCHTTDVLTKEQGLDFGQALDYVIAFEHEPDSNIGFPPGGRKLLRHEQWIVGRGCLIPAIRGGLKRYEAGEFDRKPRTALRLFRFLLKNHLIRGIVNKEF